MFYKKFEFDRNIVSGTGASRPRNDIDPVLSEYPGLSATAIELFI